jgi:hypothetical protein
MNKLMRKAILLGVALILAMVLISLAGVPKPASAGCGSDVSWNIWNELDSHQMSDTVGGKTTDTQEMSSRSVQHSNNGQDWTNFQTHQKSGDGSSHDHEESSYSDSEGKGCNSDGIPWKFTTKSDDDKDPNGNRKKHSESIEEKNGKCVKYVRDQEWDSNGKLIKDVKSTTEIPCSKYNLEWSRVGNLSKDGVTILWGPNTTKIYLELSGDGTYKGNSEGVLDDNYSGKCVGWLTHPFSVDVTAKEVKFGDQDELEFTVKVTMHQVGFITCEGKSNDQGSPPVTFTNNFSIPIEDGASFSKVVPIPLGSGQITDTYTLKKK